MRGFTAVGRSIVAGVVIATLLLGVAPASAASAASASASASASADASASASADVPASAAPVPTAAGPSDRPRPWGWWLDVVTSPRAWEVVHAVVPVVVAADPDLAAIRLDGGPVTELTGPGPWTTSVDLSALPSGMHEVAVELTLRSGGRLPYRLPVLVDNSPPVIEDPVWTATPSLLRGNSYYYTPTITDLSDQVRLELLINGRVADTSRPNSPYDVGWTTYGRRDGVYRLTMRATDPFGQRTELHRTFTVDNTAPTVRGLTPAHKAYVPGTFTVAAAGVSDRNGIAQAELWVDGRLRGRDTRAPYRITVKAREASWFRWDVYDRAGNLTTIERHIFLDTEKPTVRVVKAPRHRARVAGRVTVTLDPSDDYRVGRVEVLVNGKVVARSSAWPYRMRVDTRKQKRVMKVRFRVYDRAGNVRTTASRTWYRR